MYVVPTTNIICNVVHRIGKDRQTKSGEAPSGVGTNYIGKDPNQGLRTRKGQPGVIMVRSSLLENIIINQISNFSYYYYHGFNSSFTYIHYSYLRLLPLIRSENYLSFRCVSDDVCRTGVVSGAKAFSITLYNEHLLIRKEINVFNANF
jgi:hypothetical protein